MVQTPRRTGLSGPAFVRLLARLTEADAPAPALSLSDRLSQWVGWTDAIVLSQALARHAAAQGEAADGAENSGGSAERASAANASRAPAVAAAERAAARPQAVVDAPGQMQAQADVDRLIATLQKAIKMPRGASARPVGRNARAAAAMPTRSAASGAAPAREAPETAVDYAIHRQRYLAMQQNMETSIAALRARLRGQLAAQSAQMKQLALLDAVMERALAGRERTLLGRVPVLLERHFQRLARQGRPPQDGAQGDALQPGPWLDKFRDDMRGLLLAELEVRLHPIRGLLAALCGA